MYGNDGVITPFGNVALPGKATTEVDITDVSVYSGKPDVNGIIVYAPDPALLRLKGPASVDTASSAARVLGCSR